MIKIFLIDSIPIIIPLIILVMVVGFFVYLWVNTFHPANKEKYEKAAHQPLDSDH